MTEKENNNNNLTVLILLHSRTNTVSSKRDRTQDCVEMSGQQ